jgi:phage gp36-like protein
MSAYCQLSDVQGLIQANDLIALTDDNQTGQLNQTVLNSVITSSSGVIDRYVSNIYTVPFASPYPSAIVNAALIITCYNLYLRRETPTELNKFKKDYEDTISYLRAINKGEMHIDQVPQRSFTQGAYTGRITTYGGSGIFAGSLSNTQ